MSENQKSGASLGGGELAPALKESLRKYENLCSEMEKLAAAAACLDRAERGERLAADFSALPPLPEEFRELLEKRFAEAKKAVERAAAGDEGRRKDADKLKSELAAIRDAGDLATLAEISALKKRWFDFWGDEACAKAEWDAAVGETEKRLTDEEAEKLRRGAEAEKLAAEWNALVSSGDPEALKNRRAELESAYAALGEVAKPYSTRYQEAHRKAQIMLARHYETLDYARWESYTLKLDLLAELEKLKAAPDSAMGDASKTLTSIRDKWKALGSVPKEKSDEVNPRYLELTRELQHRVDEYFSNRRQEQKSAAEEKTRLCEEAEKNAERTDWGPGSAAFRELQAKWKSLPRSGAKEGELFGRFHAACDKFFTARNAAFAERDKRFAAAAAAKRKLIDEIATMTDVRRAKNLRSEYNAIGGAGREEKELFSAFNAALDKFFADRNAAFAEKEQRGRALVAELEKLAADPVAGAARARAIRDEFAELNCRKLLGAMDKAEETFARARKEAEKTARAGKWKEFVAAARTAARLLADNAAELPEELAKFPKLQQSLEAARAEDRTAWNKLAAHAEKECGRIIAEAEALRGGAKDAPQLDLAAELQAAIMGNFARREAEAQKPKRSLDDLRKEFMTLGALPPETLEKALELLEDK